MNRRTSPGSQDAVKVEQRALRFRCRLYRVSDGLTRSASAGEYVEVWDYKEAPVVRDLPNGKAKEFVGASRQSVRGAVDKYRVANNIRSVGSWNGRGTV